MKYHVDLHARVDANITVKAGHDLAHKLKDTLRQEIPELGHVLIHVEPN
jgi:divalent metal cation (Fe/Co/Zn/Cd) transporter